MTVFLEDVFISIFETYFNVTDRIYILDKLNHKYQTHGQIIKEKCLVISNTTKKYQTKLDCSMMHKILPSILTPNELVEIVDCCLNIKDYLDIVIDCILRCKFINNQPGICYLKYLNILPEFKTSRHALRKKVKVKKYICHNIVVYEEKKVDAVYFTNYSKTSKILKSYTVAALVY